MDPSGLIGTIALEQGEFQPSYNYAHGFRVDVALRATEAPSPGLIKRFLAWLGLGTAVAMSEAADGSEEATDGEAAEASEAAANAGSAAQPRTPEDLVEDDATVRNETGRGTRHKDDVNRPGGAAAAEEEFDEIVVPSSIRYHPNGVRTGSTPDGRGVVLYPKSSAGSGHAATIRIDRPGSRGEAQIKIRYPEGL